MKKLLQVVGLATIAAAIFWAVQRWLERSTVTPARTPRRPVENWENEGGALAPHPSGIETSQVPR